MVKFSEKQKQYILSRVESAKETAKECQLKYQIRIDVSCDYKLYLLGALESVLSDLCDKSAFDLFDIK